MFWVYIIVFVYMQRTSKEEKQEEPDGKEEEEKRENDVYICKERWMFAYVYMQRTKEEEKQEPEEREERRKNGVYIYMCGRKFGYKIMPGIVIIIMKLSFLHLKKQNKKQTRRRKKTKKQTHPKPHSTTQEATSSSQDLIQQNRNQPISDISESQNQHQLHPIEHPHDKTPTRKVFTFPPID